jgi:hypothetical protein
MPVLEIIVEVKVMCSRGPTGDAEAAVDAGELEHDTTSCSLSECVCGGFGVIAEDGTDSTDLHHKTWFVLRWSLDRGKRVSVLPFSAILTDLRSRWGPTGGL